MTPLRRKRLLLLAQVPHNHKRWYSQYCKLINDGLVDWQLGTAFLTDKGCAKLREMQECPDMVTERLGPREPQVDNKGDF